MASWWELLACPCCGNDLDQAELGFSCEACDTLFPVVGGIPRFLDAQARENLMESPDGNAMEQGYRQPSSLLASLRKIISSEYFPGKAWREARATTLATEGSCLVIGSGITRLPNAIHLDIDDFPGVDVVGDAHHLPFANDSLDAILCETVLEHVPDPTKVIAEAHRVLRPGGRFFFIVPFLFPFHGHPNDFQRWSQEGLAASFSAFGHIETGIHAGPCSAMVNLLSEWGYVLSGQRFPRGYVPIKGVLTALLFPLKYLDYFAHRFPEAHRMASTLYVTGTK